MSYRSTITVRCWKEHICLGCQGTFAYLFTRIVCGTGGNPETATSSAEASAFKAVKEEVDFKPCPSCGMYQPDMLGARRARRHGWILLAFMGCLLLVLLLGVFGVITADVTIWVAAAICVAALLAHLTVDWENPNRDTEGNRRSAAGMLEAGQMQQGQRGEGEPAAELRAPRWSLRQRLVYVLMLVAVGVLIMPDVIRQMRGWAINGNTQPQVVGPGDECKIFMTESISSVKGYWSANASVTATEVGNEKAPPMLLSAKSKSANWGPSISVKPSEKKTNSRLWATIRFMDREELTGKTLRVKVDMNVSYPVMVGAEFGNQTHLVSQTVEVKLSTPGAASQYNGLWWFGVLQGSGMMLVMGASLYGIAKGQQRQAPMTNVYAANDRAEEE